MKGTGFVLAATRSGSGKTLVTCGLLQALKQKGCKIAAFKCGPDYIDPMFHTKVLGVTSGNLDIYFAGEEGIRREYIKHAGEDISLVEGVMGLYDGLGGYTSEASAYHVAQALHIPVILLVDTHGMGRSVLAEIKGFLALDESHLIAGVILNRMSDTLYPTCREMIEKECQIPVVGYVRKQKEVKLDSRYLGLKLPEEITDLGKNVQSFSLDLMETVNLDLLVEIAKEKSNPLIGDRAKEDEKSGKKNKVRIGVARDEAFCFYYRENLELLEKLGAEIVYFSPMRDSHLPKGISGLILGGGYPELRAEQLQDNISMREEIRSSLEKGMPSLAECGGFMYLHEKMKTQDGREFQMAGVIPGSCYYTGKLVRFGYAQFTDGAEKYSIRGHEFHYYDSENNGEDGMAVKPVTGRTWSLGHIGKGRFWSFAHLYYGSCPELIQDYLEACREYV